ncbi:nicotinamide/nicotinic acid mononucleotide adenylyltransferase 1-like [Neosynchiropus ocellatus]
MEKLGTKKVVLLSCGSFNPVTNLHLRMFELARDHLEETGQYKVVKGIISVVGDAYKKRSLIEAEHRLKMARLAVEDSDWITVDAWESSQQEWMETVKVVRHHNQQLLDADEVDTVNYGKKRRIRDNHYESPFENENRGRPQLMLLCGGDMLESFGVPNLWKPEDIAEIVGHFGLVCITRAGSDPHKFIHQSDMLWEFRNNIHIVHEWVANEISATHVRRALRRGHSVRYLLPDRVINYIKENHLYTAESDQRNAEVLLAPLQRYTGNSELSKMLTSFCGTWDMISNVNFEGYMVALGVSPPLRKIALKLKLRKVIEQKGDQYIIKTTSTLKNYTVSFRVGQDFAEFTQGLDNRHVKSLVTWDGDKLACAQTGEKQGRGWIHWIQEDKLYLELHCEGEVCHQVFKKNVNE